MCLTCRIVVQGKRATGGQALAHGVQPSCATSASVQLTCSKNCLRCASTSGWTTLSSRCIASCNQHSRKKGCRCLTAISGRQQRSQLRLLFSSNKQSARAHLVVQHIFPKFPAVDTCACVAAEALCLCCVALQNWAPTEDLPPPPMRTPGKSLPMGSTAAPPGE